MSTKHVLYLNKSGEIGGSETSLFLLLEHLDRKAYTPIVVLPQAGPFAEKLQDIHVKVILTPLRTIHWRGGNPFPYLATVFRLARIIRRERIDIVHSNNDVTNQYGAVAARLCGVPIVCHLRDMSSRTSVRHAFLPWADQLIANSHAVAQSYLRHRPTPEEVSVIYNGVDLSEYDGCLEDGQYFRKEVGIPTGRFLLGIVGRIVAAKGHHVLIQAMARIAQTGEDFRLVVIGPIETVSRDPYQVDQAFLADLRKQIDSTGLSGKVTFVGARKHMPAVYRALDALVLPSLQEAFGRTLLEAMATGIPVIASAVGGTPEVVEAGVAGLLVPPGDVIALAEAILTLIRNRETARRMGVEGRRRVERLFDIKTNVQETERIYRRMPEPKHNQ